MIIDPKFSKNVGKYVFQCMLAMITILAVLLFLDVLTETAIIAALGSSAFVVFTMPHTYSSEPRRLLGGYFFGAIAGLISYYASSILVFNTLLFSSSVTIAVFGGLAVALAIFLMVITNSEHAPAAGIALGLVLNKWSLLTVLFIFSAVLFMAAMRKLLKPYMMDLIG